MHTNTATPFTPNAVYSVPSLNIHYDIELAANDKTARIKDGSFITEWLPVVEFNGSFILDPYGYMIPYNGIKRTQTTPTMQSFSFVHTTNGQRLTFSGPDMHPRAAVHQLKNLYPDTWGNYKCYSISSRFPVVVADTIYKLTDGTYWPVDMPDDVIALLLPYVGDRETRLVFDYGDTNTGQSWGEVWGTTGFIGRSMGPIKIPLLIFNNRSLGGSALSGNIVRVLTAKGKRILYQHPQYKPAQQ